MLPATSFLPFIFSLATARALSKSASPQAKRSYPFSSLVAYGDELSDNGSGSFAHGITGDPAKVYGFGTWTNGPVAVSHLAEQLGVPLTDYAFGGCCGGASFGATLDNTYTRSEAGATDMVGQVHNYTDGHGAPGIRSSLQFLWFGLNDVSPHTDAFWGGDPKNAQFASEAARRIGTQVANLLRRGAPYVLVANIYPKHLAPVTARYLCGTDADCVRTFGDVIQRANGALQKSLAQFGAKVIYYDVYSFMVKLLSNAGAHGFTKPLGHFCDGDGDASWKDCMVDGHAGQYFWMNFVQPTTTVHKLIAQDMKKAIDSHLA